jgi:hypothetical protein
VISVCNPHTLLSFQRRAPVSCVATVAGFPLTVNRRFSHWRFTSADRRHKRRACYSLQIDVDRASAAPSSPLTWPKPCEPRSSPPTNTFRVNRRILLRARAASVQQVLPERSNWGPTTWPSTSTQTLSIALHPVGSTFGDLTVRWSHRKALADFCSAAQPAGTTAGTSLSSSRELTA